jgi:hypothetical protein
MIFAVCMMATAFGKAPEKDAVYKLISKSYTLNKDGSTEFRKRTELQIFTRMTFDHFGETFITYNPDFQELIINEAYTIRKDGSRVETPANAFNPMLPDGCTKCERLNGIRTMVVTHTALEYDALIVLDYTIRSKNFFFQEFLEKVELQEEVPVEKYVVSITAPFVRHMTHLLIGENLHYKTTESNDYETYTYTFTDLPERPTDEYLFPNAIASLTFCSLLDENSLVGKIAQQNAMQDFNNPQISDFFRNRFTEEMTDMDKILYVRDYIHDNIQTNHLDAKVLNYMFASPQQVWESNCALPIEKNILLAGLLKSLGYDAQLAFQDNSLATDLKTVVRIALKGNTYYISADEIEDTSLDVFFAPATLIFQDGKTENVKSEPVQFTETAEITFEKDQLENPTITENNDAWRQLAKVLQPQDVNVAKVSVSQFGSKYYEMIIDGGNYGTKVRSVNIHNDRKYDVNTGKSFESYAYTITLPAGMRWLTKSSEKEIKVEGAKMYSKVEIYGNKMNIFRVLTLPAEGISAKSVKKFKAMMGEWEAPVKVVFSL